MRKYDITLQYGEHSFRRVMESDSVGHALLNTMIFVKQELMMRHLDNILVARPTKSIIKAVVI